MKAKQIMSAVASIVVALAVSVTSISVTNVEVEAATSMKVESYTGKVALKNVKGKSKTIRTGTNLLTGDNLTTQSKSTANILLDNTKAALVEESSAVTVEKSGNDIDLVVDKGSVFFDVSKKLTSKETFEIKTSNMVCGIRGTVGEVRTVIDKKKKTSKTYIYLLEGSVKVTFKANKTKKKTKTIKAGQKLTVSTNASTGKSTASVAKVVSTDIKKAVAEKIEANETLKTRVETATTSLDWTKTIEDALAGKNESAKENSKDSATTTGGGPKLSGTVAKGNIKVTYDCIYFGNYWQEDTNGDGKADKNDDKTPIKWRILNKNGDDAFIMADQIIEAYPYVAGQWRESTWEESDMRALLNGDFLNNAFTDSEQAAIKTTSVKNSGNPVHKTAATATTQDKIYLLSLEDMTNKKYGFTNYDTSYKNGGSVFFNNGISYYDLAKVRKATPFSLGMDSACGTDYMVDVKGSSTWILRTNGSSNTYYAAVSFAGYAYDSSNSLNSESGVCPVMHIDLSTANYKEAGTVTCGPTVSGGIEYSK